MIRSIPFITFILTSLFSFGQSLYKSLEFRDAFEKGSRTSTGKVSDTYWQNHATYELKAKVTPEKRMVSSSAVIWYFNESPDTLDRVVFHAYKDLYKKGSVNMQASNEDFPGDEVYSDGMVISKFLLNGKPVNLKNKKEAYYKETYYGVRLTKVLLPGDSIKLEVDWSFEIPPYVNRDGAFDASTMTVAYWYPEIAVYDDVFGWDDIVFDGSAEFYHDLSDFKVEIEVPNTFVVWGSSEPTNIKDILPETYYQRWKSAKTSSDKVTILSEKDFGSFKTKSTVWKFDAPQFRDFTFAFSDHYVWEACIYTDKFGSFMLNAAYPAANPAFGEVLGVEKEALKSFHNDFPVYKFPFNHLVVFNGETGGGMEFPGFINNENRINYKAEGVPYSNYESHKLLTFHEMMHMYFPFLMGINEKRFAWMEEGMAEFSEDYFTGVNLESPRSRARFAESTVAPMMVQTFMDTKSGMNSYDISSQSYFALLHLLGKEKFTECMIGYVDRWKGKHPTPYDYFYSFSDLSGQDLNWFWKAWYFDWGYPDVAILGVENGLLKIENVGGRPIAFSINLTLVSGEITSEMISPAVWKTSSTYDFKINTQNVKSVELKTLNGADAIKGNNTLKIQ